MSNKIFLWSPGVSNHTGKPSDNLGDLVIEESVRAELVSTFERIDKLEVASTHMRLTPAERRLARQADHIIVGGSNLLSSYMDGYFQWDLIMSDAIAMRRAILMGAGWWKEQGVCNRYTKLLLGAALSWRGWHSVRDSYALKKLKQVGFRKVLNTGCPTMWRFAGRDFSDHSRKTAPKVLVMLTDYYPAPKQDKALLDLLNRRYEEVVLWPQGAGDEKYAKELEFDGMMLESSLPALDRFLESEDRLDYIGTRLHGGIRCLNAGHRIMIIEVDNRAREISTDTGLPTVPRGDLESIEKWIQESEEIVLKLPVREIQDWKNQFE